MQMVFPEHLIRWVCVTVEKSAHAGNRGIVVMIMFTRALTLCSIFAPLYQKSLRGNNSIKQIKEEFLYLKGGGNLEFDMIPSPLCGLLVSSENPWHFSEYLVNIIDQC